MKSLYDSLCEGFTKNKAKDITALFLEKRPSAQVTTKKERNGDVIVYVNGQTAFNTEDIYNSSEWLNMMENAYQRSLKK